DEDAPPVIALGPGNQDAWPTSTGWSRLQARFAGAPEALAAVRELRAPLTAAEAVEAGLVTDAVDELDWEDDLRIAVEERLSLSPDALTGMEASLRFPGPETMESKIFARLTAWQNWVFQRPNATGPAGALTRFGTAERPRFDWTRC
ncbi:MAG TPA: benzoyl-CoA-dihydrodiol lyase, partial [Polyangiaceae bacterium LLY-WYZ-14_1]|nr:benzoyl-CoA-dihydrodiol lyase [Polyangiaceae bacterium LLY-WYZ-14_1]